MLTKEDGVTRDAGEWETHKHTDEADSKIVAIQYGCI